MSSSLQGFVFEKNLNSWRSKCKMKVWESPFIPSHLTFKKFQISLNFTQATTPQSNNNQNYLFNITFQNLEFWDVTPSFRATRGKSDIDSCNGRCRRTLAPTAAVGL